PRIIRPASPPVEGEAGLLLSIPIPRTFNTVLRAAVELARVRSGIIIVEIRNSYNRKEGQQHALSTTFGGQTGIICSYLCDPGMFAAPGPTTPGAGHVPGRKYVIGLCWLVSVALYLAPCDWQRQSWRHDHFFGQRYHYPIVDLRAVND